MPAPIGYSTRTLKDFLGHDFGESAPVRIDQQRIDSFADVTGDHQWIHVDEARARAESPFGGTVAHGFLTLSLLAAEVANAGVVPPDAQGVLNYGLEEIRFIAPVPAGSMVTTRFWLIDVTPKGEGRQLLRIAAVAQVEGAEKPSIVGEMLALVLG